jgi:integrase
MRRTILTDKGVAALRPRERDFLFPDPELRGHYVRVQPAGTKSFVAVARNPNGKQVWSRINATDLMTITEARDKARAVITRVRAGLPAFEAPPTKPDSFEDVAEKWLKLHGEKNKLRSLKNIKRLLHVHVYPHPRFKDRPFRDIKRSDVTALLDTVEDNGARQADLVRTIISSIMNWFAEREDDYASVIPKKMRKRDTAKPRDRILDDDEIRAIWKAAESESAGRFGAIVRLCLLTAQRRTVVATMRWEHLFGDKWAIPQMPREKENAGLVQLPKVALDIIRAQPQTGNPYVFGMRQNKPFSGFSVTKTKFDEELPGLKPWVLHDLRRTARSLMSRAGVSDNHAERVMGHAIGGMKGVYDRHPYSDEKRDALAALANLIDGIIRPRDNVAPMRKRAKRS